MELINLPFEYLRLNKTDANKFNFSIPKSIHRRHIFSQINFAFF